jgi:MFS-type transporter involved in bile tolerance (Atg22 family)
MVLGGALLVIALPPTLWMLRVPSAADIGLGLDGDPLAPQDHRPADPHSSSRQENVGSPLGELLGQRSFQLIIAATVVYYLTYSGVLAHQAAIVESSSISSGAASLVVGATAGFAALGALLIGYVIDRFSVKVATVAQHVLMGIGVLCLLAMTSRPSLGLLAIHAVCFGLAIGGTDVFWITLLKRTIPTVFFQRAWGMWYFTELAVIVVAPAAAGGLYDLSGSYVTALSSELAIMAVPLVLCLLVSGCSNSPLLRTQD